MKVVQLSVYRRDNRKHSVRNWRRQAWIGGGMVLVGLLAVLVYHWRGPIKAGASLARAFVLENPYFFVREIQVRGGEKVGGAEIVAMAGLRHGMNMWSIDPAAIESKIARHPWVRRVLVRRELPRRVVIEVEERTPKRSWRCGNSTMSTPTVWFLNKWERGKPLISRSSPDYAQNNWRSPIRRSVKRSGMPCDSG